VAEGQANALMEQAKGEAEATRIRAEAQAVANQLLAESLTAELISYQQVQRWDGKLPVFSGNGMLPLLDSSNLLNPAAEPAAAAPTAAPAP
jgi:regulator of protease activity HflC (stomatin/prohibitin superfamily)